MLPRSDSFCYWCAGRRFCFYLSTRKMSGYGNFAFVCDCIIVIIMGFAWS